MIVVRAFFFLSIVEIEARPGGSVPDPDFMDPHLDPTHLLAIVFIRTIFVDTTLLIKSSHKC